MQSAEERKAYQKQYREKNRDKRIAYGKKWRIENHDYLRAKQNEYEKTRNAKPEIKERRQAKNFKYNYDTSIEWYNEKFAKQGGLCVICGKPETVVDVRTGQVRALSIDHNHETGKNRDLLCGDCNRGIGLFHENIEIIEKVIQYLKNHKE